MAPVDVVAEDRLQAFEITRAGGERQQRHVVLPLRASLLQPVQHISEEFPYTNPNLAARKLLSKEEQENPASYPPGNPKLSTFRDIGPMAAEVDKLFTDLKAKSGT